MLPIDFPFDLYPVAVGVGVSFALFFVEFFFRKANIKKGLATNFEILIVVSAAVGFISAILFQNLYDFIESPSTYTWTWAMTFFGGLIGGVITFFAGYFLFLRKRHPYSIVPLTIIAGGGIPLAHGFGRIGCTLEGCCYGNPIDASSPFYWMGVEFRTTPGVKVWPTQLMEAIFLLILATVLIVIAFKKMTTLTLPIYCISYGIFRFLIEFLRGDHRGDFIPGISPSQFWALLLAVGGIVYLVILIVLKKLKLSDFQVELNKIESKEEVVQTEK